MLGHSYWLILQATDVDTGPFGSAGIVYSLVGYGNNRYEV